MEYIRPVIIPIPHRCGKFIRAELYFDAKWMMISEVLFESGEYLLEIYNLYIHVLYFSSMCQHTLDTGYYEACACVQNVLTYMGLTYEL